MLKIRALKIEVLTSGGRYGTELRFSDGLNIVRGNNTSGKSTCVQAILYGLGMEELLGGQGSKTMQSVLKDLVEVDDEVFQVIESFVYLEIENYKIVTTKRSVQSQSREFKLVDVYEGPYITDNGDAIAGKSYYLFDPNSAQDINHGFHAYLEDFLGWQLPQLINAQGNEAKLYLQTIFPAFFIEQKSGWSDFLATIPFLGLRNVESKVVEFLLNLDIIENDIRKQEIRQEKQNVISKWESLRLRLIDLAHSGSCVLRGYPSKPEDIENVELVKLNFFYQNKAITIKEYIDVLQEQYNKLQEIATPKVGEKSTELELKSKELEALVLEGDIFYEKLNQGLSSERQKISYLQSQLKDTKKDIESYKAEIKLQNLGSTLDFSVSNDTCPTCQQHLNGSLLPQNLGQQVMTNDENLTYLRAQQKMIEVYIQNANQNIQRNELELQQLSKKLVDQRTEIRSIKRTLMTDDRLPSEADIEKKILLRQRLDFYFRLEEKFKDVRSEIVFISSDWVKLLVAENKIPKNLISPLDARKHNELEQYFRILLGKFGYTSKDPRSIRISIDKYQPTVEGLAMRKEFSDKGKKNYDIRYDSSASDFVRTIWAYTCTLYKVSSVFNGNHPGLIVMDEPEQHSMSDQSIRNLLLELSSYKACQSIIAASFHNEDAIFQSAVAGLDCTVLNLGRKAIGPIN